MLALVAHANRIVTREELSSLVWGGETFVDFEQGLNFCIKQIRAALGDAADNPRFVETAPRRGYRFIAPVEQVAAPAPEPPANAAAAVDLAVAPPPVARRIPLRLGVAAGLVLIAASATAVVWFGGARQSAPPSTSMIAVLPFKNLSGDPAQEYFSDGFTEELIAQLGRTNPERLRVIARTSTLSYRDTKKSAADIGRELGAQHLVEGTVRRSGDRVRINAQLIRVSDQSHVWAEIYEGELRDILQLQREVGDAISRQIVSSLRPVATSASQARIVDPAVYDLYLRGRYYWSKRLGPDVVKAADTFREAIRRDPGFASAYAGLAETLVTTSRAEALEAAERAIRLDDGLAEAHTAKAMVLGHMLRWDWAEEEYRRAIALDPSLSETRYFYGEFLAARGRCGSATDEALQAIALDPKSAIATHVAGVVLYYCGEFERALPYFRKALELDPQHVWSHLRMAYVLERRGEYDAALAEHALVKAPSRAAYAYAVAGRTAEARRIIEETLNAPSAEYEAYYLAQAYVGLGEYDQALKWLDLALSLQHHDVIFLYAEPRFEPLRGLPGYQALLRKGGWR